MQSTVEPSLKDEATYRQMCTYFSWKYPDTDLSESRMQYYMRKYNIQPCKIRGLRFYFDREAQERIETIVKNRYEDKYYIAWEKEELHRDLAALREEVKMLKERLAYLQSTQEREEIQQGTKQKMIMDCY